jgi:hypothetical protein
MEKSTSTVTQPVVTTFFVIEDQQGNKSQIEIEGCGQETCRLARTSYPGCKIHLVDKGCFSINGKDANRVNKQYKMVYGVKKENYDGLEPSGYYQEHNRLQANYYKEQQKLHELWQK